MKYNLTSIFQEPLFNLVASSIVDVDIQIQADQDNFLELECPENIRDKIEVAYKNGTLKIGVKNNIFLQLDEPFNVVVKSSSIKNIKVSGISGVKGTCFVDSLSLDISGSSSVDITGVAQKLDLTLSGTSESNLSKFEAEKVAANISGVSKARFVATDDLLVNISGASNAKIVGNPKVCVINTSGVSQVKVDKNDYTQSTPTAPAATPIDNSDMSDYRSASGPEEKEILNSQLSAKTGSIAQTLRSFFRR